MRKLLFLLSALLLLSGCSGRDFGWSTDLWGNPYPPDAAELEARSEEMRELRTSAENLRVSWSSPDELLRLCGQYEELLAYTQGRVKEELERYYEGLSPAEQKRFGSPDPLPGETDEDHRARAAERFSQLRDAAAQSFDPDLYNDFWKLSQSTYLLAEMLDDDDDKDRKLELYQQALDNAERAMACFPSFRKAIAAGEAEEVAAKEIPLDGIEGVYWTVVSLSKWSRLKGFSHVLFNKNKGWEMIQHVRELDADWFYGAADRYLGAYYAVAPSIAGGDMELSEEHFKAALEAAPYYLATSVLYAEFYATKMQDEDLFKERLQFVIDAPLDKYPDVVPIQRVEKEKARKLLAEISEYF